MTDPNTRQRMKSASRKAQLTRIAAQIFAEEGYAGTSIDCISKQVGLTGPALYRHFSSKQEILDVVCIGALEHALELALEIQSEADLKAEDMLRKLIRVRIDYLCSSMSAPYLLAASQKVHLSKAARGRANALQQRFRAICGSMLKKMKPAASDVEIEVAFFAVQNMLVYTTWREKDRGTVPEEELKCLLEQITWNTLLAQGCQDLLVTKTACSDMSDTSGSELNRRDELLGIASRYFLSKGYLATSMDEIAEAAGTSGPALYRFFESKQDMLDSICVTGMEMKLKGVQEAVARGYRDPRDTLRDLINSRIDFAFGPWGYQVPITEAEYQHLSPVAAKKISTAAEINRLEWFRCLVQIRPDTPTRKLLLTIYAVLTEITYVALHIDDLGLNEDIRPILQRMAWKGLIER